MKKILYVLLIFVSACTVSKKDEANIKKLQEDAPLQEAFNITYIYSDSAVIQAKLNAPHVIEKLVNKEMVSFFDRGMHLEFYSPEGTVESELTANEGDINIKSGIAEARGNVVVYNRNGDKLETEKLNWDKEHDKIYTDQFVKIRTKDEIIYGDSLEANNNFTDFKIFSIRGIFNLKDE